MVPSWLKMYTVSNIIAYNMMYDRWAKMISKKLNSRMRILFQKLWLKELTCCCGPPPPPPQPPLLHPAPGHPPSQLLPWKVMTSQNVDKFHCHVPMHCTYVNLNFVSKAWHIPGPRPLCQVDKEGRPMVTVH